MPTKVSLPTAGDVIRIKGSKIGLLVISAGPITSSDDLRSASYHGYSFTTIKIDDVNRPNPAEKIWTVDHPHFSLGGSNMVKPDSITMIQTGLKVTKTTTYSIHLKFIGQTSRIGA